MNKEIFDPYKEMLQKFKTYTDDQWTELFHDINDFDVVKLIACSARFFLNKQRDEK